MIWLCFSVVFSNTLKNDEHIDKIPYFFHGLYMQYNKDFTTKAINKYINQNKFLNVSQKNLILYKIYISLSYGAFLAINIEWIWFMKKAYKCATNNKERAYIHFLFSKNYLNFYNGNYSNTDFERAKDHYFKALSFAIEDQEQDFIRELGSYFR